MQGTWFDGRGESAHAVLEDGTGEWHEGPRYIAEAAFNNEGRANSWNSARCSPRPANSVEVAPIWTNSGRFRPNWGLRRPIGRTRAKLAQIRSSRPKLASLGPESTTVRPTSTDFEPCPPTSTKFGPSLTKFGWTSASIGSKSSKVGQSCPGTDKFWPKPAKLGPKSTEPSPTATELCPNSADSDQNSRGIDQTWPGTGKRRPELHKTWPDIDKLRILGKFCTTLHGIGQFRPEFAQIKPPGMPIEPGNVRGGGENQHTRAKRLSCRFVPSSPLQEPSALPSIVARSTHAFALCCQPPPRASFSREVEALADRTTRREHARHRRSHRRPAPLGRGQRLRPRDMPVRSGLGSAELSSRPPRRGRPRTAWP